MDKLILVLYIDVNGLEDREAAGLVREVGNKLFTEEVIEKTNATTFVIPVSGGGTRLECINPKFIVDADVLREHRIKLDILNENFNHFISQIENGRE